MGKRTYIIAEAGVNHNGSLDTAFELVEHASLAGADAVKFQTFNADNLVSKSMPKVGYQKKRTNSYESQYSMLKKLELSASSHRELYKYSQSLGIKFLSTAFDSDSLKFLVNDLQLDKLKVPSGEITNGPLLLEYARTQRELIVSTGMATLNEIESALGVLAFGFIAKGRPSRRAFKNAYASALGKSMLQKKVTLLHCTTDYPASPDQINLEAIGGMRKALGLNIGYSDHSEGIVISIAAAALGACVIEKHFTLNKSFQGPDHLASIDPLELKTMVESIRIVDRALGNGEKLPQISELKHRNFVRKCLVAAKDLNPGDVYSEGNITAKRAGSGRSPMDYWDILGSEIKAKLKKDDPIP